jgi:hypothetical protein
MTIVYEHSFDINEWYVILCVIILSLIVVLLPKIFSLLEGIAHYSYGIFIGMFFDHTVSVSPWDFYDVNDTSKYQLLDFLSYIMYGPYSYFFIYLYVKLNIRGFMNIVYVVLWACFSILMERIALKIDLFHYEKGYSTYWSIPIYLTAQTLQIVFYHVIQYKNKTE